MKLKEISEVTCIHCGALVVSESVRSVHTNGHGFEIREFKCGRTLAFIPNFMRIEVKRECPNNITEQIKTEKRATAFESLTNFIEQLDVDDQWKEDVTSSVNYHKPRQYFRI